MIILKAISTLCLKQLFEKHLIFCSHWDSSITFKHPKIVYSSRFPLRQLSLHCTLAILQHRKPEKNPLKPSNNKFPSSLKEIFIFAFPSLNPKEKVYISSSLELHSDTIRRVILLFSLNFHTEMRKVFSSGQPHRWTCNKCREVMQSV